MQKELHYHLYNGGNCGMCNVLLSLETGIALSILTGRKLFVYYTHPIFNSDRGECIQDLFDIPETVTFVRGEPDAEWLIPYSLHELALYSKELPDAEFLDGRTSFDLSTLDHKNSIGTCDDLTLVQWNYGVFIPAASRGVVSRIINASIQPREDIRDMTEYGSMTDRPYSALHVRRADYLAVAGTNFPSIAEMMPIIQANCPSDYLLIVYTDESDLSFFAPLQEHYPMVVINPEPDLSTAMDVSKLERALIDMYQAGYATSFVGTMYSTFTGRINHLRRQHGYHQSPRYLFTHTPEIPINHLGEVIEKPFGRWPWNRVAIQDNMRPNNGWWHRWEGDVPNPWLTNSAVTIIPDGVTPQEVAFLLSEAQGCNQFYERENRNTKVLQGNAHLAASAMFRLRQQLRNIPGEVDYNVQLFFQFTGGQTFLHCDSLDPRDGTRRIASVLVYLNDDYVGGELSFPEMNLTIKPKAGTVIAYPLVNEWGEQDPRMAHQAALITEGDKCMGYFNLRY